MMDSSLIEVFFALLRFEIVGAELCGDIKEKTTIERLPVLFQLAKKHDLAHLIGDALDKNGLLPDGLGIKNRFLQERNMAVYRCEQLRYELECISEVLLQIKIPFIPLKGAVLRLLYPEEWMRTSCDIDILIEKENLKVAIETLEEKLGYRCTKIDQHDVQIFSENGVHIELHFSLLESGSKDAVERVLNRIWYCVEKEKICCEMPDDLLYVYIISHMAKHIKFGGCGVRSFVDIWLLNHKIIFDKEARVVLLQETGLLKLAQAIEALSETWMVGQRVDEIGEFFAEYILTGGIYGISANKIAAQKSKKRNRVSYLLSRLFLPFGQMKYKYQILQKYPILYPFYIIKRMILLFKKSSKKRVISEINQVFNCDEENQRCVSKLLKDLDL